MVRLFVHVSKSTRAHFDLRHRVPRVRRPWGLRIRVLAAAGAIALVSAITFGLLLNALLDQQRAAGPARDVTEARNAINAIQRLSQDLETGARGFLLTQDRSFLDPYTAARRELPRQLAALAAVPNDADQRARTAELRRELAAYTSYLEDVDRARRRLRRHRAGGPAPVRRDPRDGHGAGLPPSARAAPAPRPERRSAGALDRRRRHRARRPADPDRRSSPTAPCAASSSRSTGCRASRASSGRAATAPACPSRARRRPWSWPRPSTPPRSAWRRRRPSCGGSASATWPSSTPSSPRRRSGWRSSTRSCATCASTTRWRR